MFTRFNIVASLSHTNDSRSYRQAVMKFPQDYPYSPPSIRFVSKVWHPNVYENGDLCISILHQPVEDSTSGELPCERWNPTQVSCHQHVKVSFLQLYISFISATHRMWERFSSPSSLCSMNPTHFLLQMSMRASCIADGVTPTDAIMNIQILLGKSVQSIKSIKMDPNSSSLLYFFVFNLKLNLLTVCFSFFSSSFLHTLALCMLMMIWFVSETFKRKENKHCNRK